MARVRWVELRATGLALAITSVALPAAAQTSGDLDACAMGVLDGCFRGAGVEVPADVGTAADVFSSSGDRCIAGDLDACVLHGVMGSVSGEEDARILDRLSAACDAGRARACSVAFIYAGDDARAVPWAERACNLHDEDACINVALGRMQTPADAPRAWSLIEEACDRGAARACVLSAARWLEGTGAGAAPDLLRARQRLERSCELGEDVGCALLAQRALRGAPGSVLDRAGALRMLEERCDRPSGNYTCESLAAVVAEQHEEGAADPARAAALYGRACRLGNPHACRSLGAHHEQGLGVTGDFARAAELYERACRGRDETACAWSGDMHGSGVGVPRDLDRAFEQWSRACELGHEDACVILARRESVRPPRPGEVDERIAAAHAAAACDTGDLEGCIDSADRHATGRGVPRSLSSAVPLYRRACEGGALRACGALGALFVHGVGVPRDREAGLALLDRACAVRAADACEVAELVRHPPPRPQPFGM
jgi:TPR repeat protein